MPNITLPDGAVRQFDKPVSIMDVAADIGAGLARATLAGSVDGVLKDASFVIEKDCKLSLITEKNPEGLDVLRHSCAHLLAQAVQSVYPKAQVTIGPVIEDGFYYDFAFERPFTPEDLALFEKKMKELAKKDLPVERNEFTREEAIEKFSAMGESYKVEIIKDIPAGEVLSFYRQGDFVDLCRGPHVPSTGKLKHFKLTKLAGAYWRGDSKNAMLQRIYGTCWATKEDLNAYVTRLEEAKKRDHRVIGKKLGFFHFQEEAPGMVFWHDKGWRINTIIRDYVAKFMRSCGYQMINTPQVVDISLWEQSGHLENFAQNMYVVNIDERSFAIKPMNCPCHVQVFKQGITSHRDLPIRLGEFGSCHRYEPHGSLHGVMRARNFVQDDAHIFCTEGQIQSEVQKFIDELYEVYRDFGFNDVIIKLSTRPEARVGSDEIWDKAEAALAQALDSKGIEFEELPGEGAFYGPKIEFSLKDCMGRVWQCGTIQVDFSMPGRLGAEYIDEESNKQVPVMLHRAILGSIERFIGILIEETAGALPLWLAPTQVVIASITDRQNDYAEEIRQLCEKSGIRATVDLRNEKIGFKIREHTLQKAPYMLILGDAELNDRTVSVRTRSGEEVKGVAIDDFIRELINFCESKSRKEVVEGLPFGNQRKREEAATSS